MSAACCAPRRCTRRARKRAKGEITAAELKAVEDREIERVIKKQEEVGLQAITDGEFRRSWWHLDFLWGLDGAEKHVMDTGIAFAAVTTRNEGVQGDRQARHGRAASDGRAFQVRRGAHQAHAEDHHPGAVGDLRPADRDADRQEGLSDDGRVLGRSRQGLQEGGARLRRRRLPLSAARRGVHRHAVRSEIPPADDGPRRRSGKARPALRRAHQCRDVGHSRPT